MDSEILEQAYLGLMIVGGLVVLALVLLFIAFLWALVTDLLWKRFCDSRDIGHIMAMVKWAEENGPFETNRDIEVEVPVTLQKDKNPEK